MVEYRSQSNSRLFVLAPSASTSSKLTSGKAREEERAQLDQQENVNRRRRRNKLDSRSNRCKGKNETRHERTKVSFLALSFRSPSTVRVHSQSVRSSTLEDERQSQPDRVERSELCSELDSQDRESDEEQDDDGDGQ